MLPTGGERITVIFINNAIYGDDRRPDGANYPPQARKPVPVLGDVIV